MQKSVKGKAKLVWGSTPAGTLWGGNVEPGTEEFFQTVLKKRFTYEIPWILELVPFVSFNQRKVLELGCGAGYDAYQFCRNGSDYTGIDIALENAERVKKNLGFYGYSPKVAEGDAENLPFKDSSFKMVFSNGVLHHIPNIEKCFCETHRVLGCHGEFYVIVYHKHSIFYWMTLFLFDHLLGLGFMRRGFKERLSLIEYTTSKELPLVNVYTRRRLRRMLEKAGFAVESLWVRKLVKEDMPAIPFLANLWRYIPQPWLDYFGKYFGWYLIVKAKKV
jgi:ubiquinone/menaquinone biosynthesis C-methylase UbiE